jgi:hypothetical protein
VDRDRHDRLDDHDQGKTVNVRETHYTLNAAIPSGTSFAPTWVVQGSAKTNPTTTGATSGIRLYMGLGTDIDAPVGYSETDTGNNAFTQAQGDWIFLTP